MRDETCWLDQNLLNLYANFVVKFESKINPLKYVTQVFKIVKRQAANPEEALRAMELVASKSFLTEDAKVVAKLFVAQLLCNDPSSLDRVKQCLDEVQPNLSTLAEQSLDVEETNTLFSAFYQTELIYYKKVGPPTAFYTSALSYLAFTPQADNTKELAHDLCVAVIVAEDAFNFGEVLCEEIIQKDLQERWLIDLLVCFNNGDVQAFNNVIAKNQKAFEANKNFVVSFNVMKQKVALLCLMRLVFERPTDDRTVTFEAIAKETQLPPDQVEWLIMRAFSKKLLKGKMDQTRGTLHVTWLTSRVLEKNQMINLNDKLNTWIDKVSETIKFKLVAPELFNI